MTPRLNDRFTFDSYVVGAGNQMAVAAGRTVAENPGLAYNPLFIYSATGLGKTHLLGAIGHAVLVHNPEASVEYLTLEEFIEAYHAALAQGQAESFRRRFHDVDVLLLDDVQFLADRREMQSELLGLTETVQGTEHQVVFTSDRPPSDIADLDERLISRFSGGLVVDIGEPDYETRVAILRRNAEERSAVLADGVVEAVANAEVANVRELLGQFNRILAHQAISDAPLTPEAARNLLSVRESVPAGGSTAEETEDEFSQFLRDITLTVTRTVESWRAKVAEAVLRWESERYRTRRLEALLEQDAPEDPEAVLASFERDVDRLRELQETVQALDPQAGGASVFRDPDRLAEAEEFAARVQEGVQPPPGPDPAVTFEGFAVGSSDRMALQAAHAVVAEPGNKYNPLVLIGPAGVGKSHLLHAIGNVLAAQSDAVVACLSMHSFIEELIAAIEGERVDWWRSRYRRATALLLDDVQLAAGKERTQEELFHLFNVFAGEKRQMVFTANVVLAKLEGIESRLISRLEGGLVAELAAPDREVRRAVVERLLSAQQIEDSALLTYLADRPADSVRSVYGLVQRVLRAAEAEAERLSVGFARTVVEGRAAGSKAPAPVRRTSGATIAPAGGLKSQDKMIWVWPDVRDRMLEELR